MKRFCRIIVLILAAAHLFAVSAAGEEIPAEVLEVMRAAAAGMAVPSGAAAGAGVSSDTGKETDPGSDNAEESADASKTEEDEKEYGPVTKPGTAFDVMIGGLEIHPGVWYTVVDGELTSAPPWPDSYLYYSHSQSKITLHEFHYTIPSDRHGNDDTFAALYIPSDMHIVLEGDNELVNRGYSKSSGRSNGVNAGSSRITFEGNGVLSVNTRADDGLAGYGVAASGGIVISGEFIGLKVFGPTAAFQSRPQVADNREMIVQYADLHPEYHENVRVRDASPYDSRVFTQNRYVLFAVGKELSPMEQMRARLEAEYYQTRYDYDTAVEEGYSQAFNDFSVAVDSSLQEFQQSVDNEINYLNGATEEWKSETASAFVWEEGSAGGELAQMMMGLGG